MTDQPTPLVGLEELPRYIAGSHDILDYHQPIVLSANENPRGPSPQAIAAMHRAVKNAHRYPESNPQDLKTKIAEQYMLSPEMGEILLGAGSDEIISLLCTGFAHPGSKVLISQYGFLMYPIAAKIAGAVPHFIPEQDYRADTRAIVAAADENTSMVFLANPNNPTGSYLTREEIGYLVTHLPPHVLLVLDCAYSEYVDHPDYSDHHDLVASGRVVVMHTFSKVYGLAGIRLGWALSPSSIANIYERLRSPFNVSSLAIVAGIEALSDKVHLQETLALNKQERRRLVQSLKGLGIHVFPSSTNFLLLDFGSEAGAQDAEYALIGHGILARKMAGYGLPHCLRLSIGLAEENTAVIQALQTR